MLAGLLLAVAGAAVAQAQSTGAEKAPTAAKRPVITSATCRARADCDSTRHPRAGTVIRLRGRNFVRGSKVVFYGAKGAGDNRTRRGGRRSSRVFDVRIPADAADGPVAIKPSKAPRSPLGPRLDIAEPEPAENQKATPDGNYFFPVRGDHNFGGSQSRFGAARGSRAHRGHDVFAKSGTPLAAARGGKVVWKRYQGGGAGYYVVIRGDDGTDYVYMHMLSPAVVSEGQLVTTGQNIGRVGCSGSCSGAHLHFEMWTARWYDGGKPFDPLPSLKRWDAFS